MNSITEIIGGAQGLLDISFDLQNCFEEYLNDEYKTFIHILRVIEEVQPPLVRRYRGGQKTLSVPAVHTEHLGDAVFQDRYSNGTYPTAERGNPPSAAASGV